MAETWNPLLLFDSDNVEFTRGFECGRLWQIFQHYDPEFEQHIHGSNAEMVLRMAEAEGRTVTAEPLDGTWMLLKVESRCSQARKDDHEV